MIASSTAEPRRAYLKRLSDFAVVEKEEEALNVVADHSDVQGPSPS
ncbi:MAG: hypothetical protein HWD60_02495 [Defluviicoccus sp.]|nr:MAG: hypothetical protein HWD60_02495 [Defluviicoccus sp.]